MDKLSISEDNRIVSVGPGARWGKVYEYLDPYNVTVIGGRFPHVGVGGLMLGGIFPSPNLQLVHDLQFLGGISYFTGEYGLAADNIASVEVSI
jgi:FAD/FMN-containing dehydrogenase